jgi:ornithine cyclodeaminase/alanine dehydrogenase-like protein (mu-crystallin family)
LLALCTVRSIRRAWVYDRNTDRAKALVAEMAGQDPIPQGLLAPEQVHEIGEVINGQVAGRESADQVTLFKSVGNAVQDIAAATRALRMAQERGLGTIVEL